ncbi:MAG: 4-hydroxy-tetrahydrodipicolinate synthase [Rhodospirillaceae bacterium]|nr:4-hydroxy-tetrahydrodipicolinate synthase [Rhodospirillaceae bacterium]
MFRGSIVALITPFKNGKVDADAFQRLVDWQIKEGTHGLVPCGTTGESPTLSHDEHKRVVELCVEAAAKRVPVIAGTGSNNTAEAIDLAIHAKKAGADAQLVVTPYYNKPTQEGLYQHYKALHDAAELPIVIYNIPPRCVVDMSVDTMARLAKLPRIVGVKDATGDLQRPLKTRVAIGPKFSILSGDDGVALAFRAQSADGCISVTANIAPKLCADLHNAWDRGDFAAARKLNELLIPLHEALFVETSPAPVKYAASLLGLSTADVRLPMVHATEHAQQRVRAAMEHVGLIGAKKAAAAE